MSEQAPSRELKLVSGTIKRVETEAVKDPGAPLRMGPVAVGDVINGRYLIERELGIGGVGIVYAARNIELDEQVALKFLRNEAMTDPGIVARFAREAKAAVSIKSEYVATVYDVGMLPNGVPFFVMEYLEGKNFTAVLEERRSLAPQEAAEYTLQVCEALAMAHSKGIVHRDIKPDNLMLTERATGMHIVKVLDFGISKAALTGQLFGENLPMVTTSNLMGTPMYMSPEQVRCQDNVDVRCDVWSLGMVLYEMITGSVPFHATTVPELCAAILEAQPDPIEAFRRDVPSGLSEVIYKCLEKDVSKRFQNIAELAMALLPFAPKRARLCAERAVSVLAATGRISGNMKIESVAPSAMESGPQPVVGVPPAAAVPQFAETPASLPISAPPQAVVSVPPLVSAPPTVLSGAPVEWQPAPRRTLPIAIVAGVAVVVLLGGIAAGVLATRSSHTAAAGPSTGVPTGVALPGTLPAQGFGGPPAITADAQGGQAAATAPGSAAKGALPSGKAAPYRWPGATGPASAAAPLHPSASITASPSTPPSNPVVAPAKPKPTDPDIGY